MIKTHILTQSEVQDFYTSIMIANATSNILLKDDGEFFIRVFGKKIQALLKEKMQMNFFSDDLFKLELNYLFNIVKDIPENQKMTGKKINDNYILKLLEAIEDIVIGA